LTYVDMYHRAGGLRYFRFNPLRGPKTGVPAVFWPWILPVAKSIYPQADSRGYNAIHGVALRAQSGIRAVSGL
jgi:hypothetical protein